MTEKGAELADVKLCKCHFAKGLLNHDYKLLTLRLCLEGNRIDHSWTSEHEIRSKVYKKHGLRDAKNKLIPDGLMGLEVNEKKVSVAIELELTLKNKTKLKETFRRYHNVSETFAVCYIVPSSMIMNQVHRLWYASVGASATIKIFYSYWNVDKEFYINEISQAKACGSFKVINGSGNVGSNSFTNGALRGRIKGPNSGYQSSTTKH